MRQAADCSVATHPACLLLRAADYCGSHAKWNIPFGLSLAHKNPKADKVTGELWPEEDWNTNIYTSFNVAFFLKITKSLMFSQTSVSLNCHQAAIKNGPNTCEEEGGMLKLPGEPRCGSVEQNKS